MSHPTHIAIKRSYVYRRNANHNGHCRFSRLSLLKVIVHFDKIRQHLLVTCAPSYARVHVCVYVPAALLPSSLFYFTNNKPIKHRNLNCSLSLYAYAFMYIILSYRSETEIICMRERERKIESWKAVK